MGSVWIVYNVNSLFVRETSVGILFNIFYALTRRMPLLKITSVCRTKRYRIVAESICDLKLKGTSSKYLILKVGIFDYLIGFDQIFGPHGRDFCEKSNAPHMPGFPPFGLNIDRYITISWN